MEKVGIVTITESYNYGNRLQNYAMQTNIKKLGFKAETIRVNTKNISKVFQLKFWTKNILNVNCSQYERRVYSFTKFNRKHIKFSKYSINSDEINHKISKYYDFFICGSDQIWNPYFFFNSDNKFLSFVEHKKKIAVAASFGIEELPKEEEKHVADMLKDFSAISVREKAGKEIIEKLMDKLVCVLPDPTLTLAKTEWEKIEKKPKNIPKHYILSYLLGEYEIDIQKQINEYANIENVESIYLENEYQKEKKGKHDYYDASPENFIWLIHHCDKVIADSFHAVVFALIFSKPFIVVSRPKENGTGNMQSRFLQLQEMFDIKNMFVKNDDYSSCADVDFEKAHAVMRQEKERFIKFLKENLK